MQLKTWRNRKRKQKLAHLPGKKGLHNHRTVSRINLVTDNDPLFNRFSGYDAEIIAAFCQFICRNAWVSRVRPENCYHILIFYTNLFKPFKYNPLRIAHKLIIFRPIFPKRLAHACNIFFRQAIPIIGRSKQDHFFIRRNIIFRKQLFFGKVIPAERFP